MKYADLKDSRCKDCQFVDCLKDGFQCLCKDLDKSEEAMIKTKVCGFFKRIDDYDSACWTCKNVRILDKELGEYECIYQRDLRKKGDFTDRYCFEFLGSKFGCPDYFENYEKFYNDPEAEEDYEIKEDK